MMQQLGSCDRLVTAYCIINKQDWRKPCSIQNVLALFPLNYQWRIHTITLSGQLEKDHNQIFDLRSQVLFFTNNTYHKIYCNSHSTMSGEEWVSYMSSLLGARTTLPQSELPTSPPAPHLSSSICIYIQYGCREHMHAKRRKLYTMKFLDQLVSSGVVNYA